MGIYSRCKFDRMGTLGRCSRRANSTAGRMRVGAGQELVSMAFKPESTRPSIVASNPKAGSRMVTTDDADACDVDPVNLAPRVKNGSLLDLARENFELEFGGLLQEFKDLFPGGKKLNLTPECFGFVLDDAKVGRLDQLHQKADDEPFFVRAIYEVSVWGLDILYAGRPIPRFWVLEVIARIPYFSYVSVLHLYESLGWWQNSELSKVHFAEAYAEQHHLLIMEALGGNRKWGDRFIAQHTAVLYFWIIFVMYLFSPKWSYYFMQLVEQHAADTYSVFCENNADVLKEYPPPEVAVQFYRDGDMYMFDEFQSGSAPGTRRPPVNNLYEVFQNIRDDELEHVKTMINCQDYEWLSGKQVSPHSKEAEEKRQKWTEWAEDVNARSDPTGTVVSQGRPPK
mmetsp:Transcript_26460/g.50248  ORF Transcript_26460/g.50248 Transcript_26460/m.50248 type:complete len:397 (-) Transcript_26460:446-1636(-)